MPHAVPASVKVITYNFHKGRAARGGRSIVEEAAQALREREADLLLCQEVFHTADDVSHQSRELSALLGLEHWFGPNRFYQRGCHGNATFTRYNVRRSANIEITHSFFERRGILHTLIELEDFALEVLNTHFSLTHGQRRRQLSTLLQNIPEHPTVPVLVAGDFNDWHGRLDRIIHRQRHFENALRLLPPRQRRTYPSRRPLLSLDRIYYRGFKLLDVRVLRGDPWTGLSDHLPVEAQVVPILSQAAHAAPAPRAS